MAAALRGAAAAVAILAASPAAAQTVEEFYKGRLLTIITWQGAGTSYDAYARTIGRHMGRHIPGNPTFKVQLIAGGGGILAANHVGAVAPKDGSTLFMVGPGLVVEQALAINKSLSVDLRTFGWLGSLSASNHTTVLWHTSPTRSLEMTKQRETTVGATGAGSQSYQLPAFYNAMLGTRLKIIAGYAQAAQIELAMERGELDGRGNNPWATYKAIRPQWVAERKIIPIIQTGMRKEKDLPHVPLLLDLATPTNRAPIEFISRSAAIGRPVATTPGVPADRLAALVTAFDKTVVDAEFVADIQKQKLELDPTPGPELLALVKAMIDAPQPVLEAVRKATAPPPK